MENNEKVESSKEMDAPKVFVPHEVESVGSDKPFNLFVLSGGF